MTSQVEHLKPSVLEPWAKNARTHSKKQLKQIADSIQQFGFTNPIIIDANNSILAGHGRVEAAKALGLKTVPCLRQDQMTEAEKRAYVIADNKLALNTERSGFSDVLLFCSDNARFCYIILEDALKNKRASYKWPIKRTAYFVDRTFSLHPE